MKAAILDIGSNSVRYSLVDEHTVIAEKTLNSTVLSEGLFFSGRLNEQAIARTVNAIAEFCDRAKRDGADKIFAFATEAVRSAENGDKFVQAVYSRTGIAVDVLDGKTEAEIGFLGGAAKKAAPVTLFDLGGASCEIVHGKNGKISFSRSVPLGCVRLRDGSDGTIMHTVDMLNDAFPRSLPPCDTLIGIGGSATALGAMVACPNNYDPQKSHESIVSLGFCEEIAEKFFAGVDVRALYPCLTANRARIIGFGALVSIHLMKLCGKESFTVSERDNIEGYAELKVFCK